MGETISTERGLSIEYDENIACDVCRSPECEDGNEILFCDVCDVAVHQTCYGVQKVPIGSWVCKPCTQLLSDCPCLLCSTRGGAMKKTKTKGVEGWVHMSCALWVPEVGIGNVEKMEPITRIETITPGRWNLLCYICKEKRGACIQCSVKSCVTAFHVTCGFDSGLHMQTVWDDTAPDGVRHVCYCSKHTEKRSGRSPRKASTSSIHSPLKAPQNSSSPLTTPSKSSSSYRAKEEEERENLRQNRLRGMEEEFYKYADVEDLAHELNISKELATTFHRVWTLKRKAREDAALLPPTGEQQERLSGRQIKPFQKATMEIERVVRLRQDLERIRNLCYMVEKREKQKRELTAAREAVFRKELGVVDDNSGKISSEDIRWARSCCVKNFTEYEVLQTLDLQYPARPKIYKKRGRKPKRKRMNKINGFLQTGMMTQSDGVTSEHSGECEQSDSVGDNKDALICSSDVTSDNFGDEATTSRMEVRGNSTPSREDTSSNVPDVKANMHSKLPSCSGSSNNDMSSDSDFEDEAARKEKRRASIRNRLRKLPKLDTEIVVVTRCSAAESACNSSIPTRCSSPSQSQGTLNGVVHASAHVNSPRVKGDLKNRLSPNNVQDSRFKRNRKRLFCELYDERDVPKSPRVLRSNSLVLGEEMSCNTVSDKRVCRPNGILNQKREWDDLCDSDSSNHGGRRSEEDGKFDAPLTRSRSRTSEPDSPKSSSGKNDDLRNVDVHSKNDGNKAEFCRTRSHSSRGGSIAVSLSSHRTIHVNGLSYDRKNEENKGENISLQEEISNHDDEVFDISSRTRSRSNTVDSAPSRSSPVKKDNHISRSLSTPSTTDLNCKQNGAVAERCRARPQTRLSGSSEASKATLCSPTKYSKFFGKLRPAATTIA